MRLALRLCLFSLTIFCAVAILSLVRPASAQTQTGTVIISELRLRGPNGAEDEFVEIYNNSDTPRVVQASDTTPGWAIAISNAQQQITGNICIIPNGTTIPARGHYLCANSNGYSLSGYPSGNPTPNPSPAPSPTPLFATATPDNTWQFDVPDGSGVALFTTTSTIAQTAATRLDAFGFTISPPLFREGAGWPSVPTSARQASFFRDLTNVIPKDTNNNAADFLYAGTAPDISGNLLGAPGPENLRSPVTGLNITTALLDPSQPPAAVPNRERRPTVVPNGNLGTIIIRRTFTNNTGLPVSRLRFRVAQITTLGNENTCGGVVCADVRALTSTDGEAGVGGQVVTVRGVRLEEPPTQTIGGGFNSSLSADFITLATPLAPGQSVNIQFVLGVMRTGNFRFFFNIEAQTGSSIILL
jgi:hypothetical protein